MKVTIVGIGAVGTSCAKSMLLRGSCREIVLIDIDERRARGVANDLSHGSVLCPTTIIRDGTYDDVRGSSVVIITAGINERSGGAVDRNDGLGRLRLLPHNAGVYRDVVPKIAHAEPNAIILVVTDPPDPLAQLARDLTSTNPIVSAGTYLDTIRFRLQIARHFGCLPASVTAFVLGEHGTSQVPIWSSASIGGETVLECVARQGIGPTDFRQRIESAVKHANIDIIEGTGASQHGIGIVSARITEAILRDEGLVEPVGIFHTQYGVTFSLPSVIGKEGVRSTISIPLSDEEKSALHRSAEAIRKSLEMI